MQPLLDGPRARLTNAQVRTLVQSQNTLKITYGAVALDADFRPVADISRYISSGSEIKSDVTATVHRTCTLNIDSDVADTGWSYLSGYVKPYMVFTDVASGLSGQFNLGVYTLTTPTMTLGTSPTTLTFSGFDLKYLLRQPIGDSYEVAAGQDPVEAAAVLVGLAIPEVSVTVTPSGSTLPKQMSWPFDSTNPYTYLDAIEELLASVGYRDVWADWEGEFRIEPFIDLQTSDYEWIFDTSAKAGFNIISADRTQDLDLYDVPNWFRFVMADLPDSPVEGQTMFTWTDTSPSNPGSTANRRHSVRYIETVTCATYNDLLAYGQRKIAALLGPSETFTLKTQPFPLAWHLDVFQYRDLALGGSMPTVALSQRRVVSTTWTLPLDGQSDMEWTWQTITDQSAGLGLATIATVGS